MHVGHGGYVAEDERHARNVFQLALGFIFDGYAAGPHLYVAAVGYVQNINTTHEKASIAGRLGSAPATRRTFSSEPEYARHPSARHPDHRTPSACRSSRSPSRASPAPSGAAESGSRP